MSFAANYRKGGGSSAPTIRSSKSSGGFASRYRKDAKGASPIQRSQVQKAPRDMGRINAEAERYAEEARKANSFSGIAKETGKGVLKSLLEYIPKTAVSLAEAPGAIYRQKASQREYNLPIVGKFKSYQSEAEDTAGDIVEGKKALYTALKPFVEVPLNLLPVAKGTPVRSNTLGSQYRLANQAEKGIPGQARTLATRTLSLAEQKPRGTQGQSLDRALDVASYRRNSTPTPEVNPLLQEARKYKSAEDFVKANDGKVLDLPTSVIKQYIRPRGGRSHGELMSSIEKNGFDKNQPVSLMVFPDGKAVLADGNGRALAARDLGSASIPTRIVKSSFSSDTLPGAKPFKLTDLYHQATKGEALPQISPQVLSTPRKFITSGETILRKSGESGNEMADILKRQQLDEDLMRGSYISRMKEATANLGKKELENVTDVLEGKAQPISENAAKAAKQLRGLYDEVASEAQKQKFEIQVPGGAKVPFTPRENYAPRIYNFDELTKKGRREELLQHLVDTNQARNKAEASKLFDEFISANAQRKSGNLENARMLDLPGYEKNAATAAEKYLGTAAQRFSEAKNFGKKDEVIADLVGKIADSGGDYMEAQRVFDFLTKGVPKSKAASAITQFNLVTKLDLGAITNITQSVNTITKGGVGNFLKAVTSGKEGRKLAELAGVYDDMVVLKETGINPGKFVRGVMYLFGKVERMNRFLAANTGRFRAEELIKKAKSDPNAEYAVRQLKTLGIDVNNLDKLKEKDILTAMNKMSELTQFKPNVLNLPPAWRTPLGRVAMQFKSFSYMQTKFVRDEIYREAKKGNIAPLMRFMATVPLFSYAAYQTRNFATQRDEYDDKRNLDLRKFDKFFGAGKSFFTEPVTQGDFLKDTYDNPYSTPIKKVTRTLGTFLGPTAGEIGTTIQSLEDATKVTERNRQYYENHELAQDDPYLSLKRQGVGMIPFVGEALKNRYFGFEDTPAETAKKKAIEAIKREDWQALIEAQNEDPYLRKEGAFRNLLKEAGKDTTRIKDQQIYDGLFDETVRKKKTKPFYTP